MCAVIKFFPAIAGKYVAYSLAISRSSLMQVCARSRDMQEVTLLSQRCQQNGGGGSSWQSRGSCTSLEQHRDCQSVEWTTSSDDEQKHQLVMMREDEITATTTTTTTDVWRPY